ncbi:MAG: hypothetical protein RL133_1277 [Pseudomonadota bacterium]
MNVSLAFDLVILVTLLEWPCLIWLTRGARARGLLHSFAPVPLLLVLLPGLCLLGAARVGSADREEPLVLALLAAAGLSHALYLWGRYREEMAHDDS